jgi:hypothetical protein
MRRLAWGLVVVGLVTGLAGELLVIIHNELVHRELPVPPSDDAVRLAQDNLSLWPAVGIGTAIAAFGLLLLVLRPLHARLLRRRNFAGLVPSTLRRLIIVARDELALYNYIRRDQFEDETVRVVTDRRGADRRHRMATHLPDRRRGERRRCDIDPLLLAQGWAEVRLPKS